MINLPNLDKPEPKGGFTAENAEKNKEENLCVPGLLAFGCKSAVS